ncbi:HDOD domain-containing protein [Rhodocyclus tenuis]|uniref:HDOD domain-containing protein n=2 Tax=Rhodocyclus TaxID=1064 RepID=A0A6L5JU56_RHOTE|nr:HDOD domain-containing protein [Rhodocyclus gracilis]MQY50362.1 HDOD domain-containing protein [Rhodocyclus gracilis]MRD71742.1 HDOD domain-containing protein [Rhodocyclus gracilis]NJA87865.1 HDOD domain-containing protein [Rhodocyclus gracilis]
MLDHPLPTIDAWVAYFSGTELPILRQTVRRLELAHANIDEVNGRDIAHIVLQDPLLAVRVLAYIQPFRGRHLRSDITTIASAVMMFGIEPFFRKFENPLTIESVLRDEPQAMLGVLHVLRRAQRASNYAHDWAYARHDINMEEVALAALLHDLAEVLMWCFAPHLAIKIRRLQQADHTLRSAVAQEMVLGVRIPEIQLALCSAWHLPDLLKSLMDDEHSQQPRVQNVALAVNLARHSANGWHDAALPDDYTAIASLLHISHETLMTRLKVPPDAIPPARTAPPALVAAEIPPDEESDVPPIAPVSPISPAPSDDSGSASPPAAAT